MTLTAAHLLPGTDEDFVINAYLAILGRWPDEGGLAHHMDFIADRPERRTEMLRHMLSSEEAAAHGQPLPLEGGATAVEAELAQLRLRVAFLLKAPPVPPPASDPVLAEELGRLAADLALLRREMQDRLAAVETCLAHALPSAPQLSPSMSVDFVQDQIEATQARLEARLRRLETRLLEAG